MDSNRIRIRGLGRTAGVGWQDAVITIFAAMLGFIAGLVTFKRSNRWCPRCGSTLVCPECPGGSLRRGAAR